MLQMKTTLHLSSLLCGLIVLSACDSSTPDASIDQLVDDMSQRIEVITTTEQRDNLIPRFNQPKTVACLNATFKVHDQLPANLAVGLFARPGSYSAMLRFANASEMDDSKKDIRGLSIKVSGVEGPVLWGKEGVQDFILNSYPALFVATPEEFLTFIRARQEDKKIRFFLNPFDPHLKSLWIVYKARQKINSPLDIRYWSTVPFQLGDSAQTAVKYSATPCSSYHTGQPVSPGKNQLRSAIGAHLEQQPACFTFALQTRSDPASMPIEDASVIWDEEQSPFQPVATITMQQQMFNQPAALTQCERMSFNPWQSLPQHKPLGRMNEVRRAVYARAEKFRNKEKP
jgi:catalase